MFSSSQMSVKVLSRLSGNIVPVSYTHLDDGARTRYLHLGKVALYQMSYIRIIKRAKA